MILEVSRLFIYPIKSLGGIELQSSELKPTGFRYDRRWMLVNEEGGFLSQREESRMALLGVSLSEKSLQVFSRENPDSRIVVPFMDRNELVNHPRISVTIWHDQCTVPVYPDSIGEWFSEILGQSCRLVYMDDSVQRRVDGNYARNLEITSFSDAFPILMIGQASLDDLNQKLAVPIPINRFRPNLVFTGGTPFLEDEMSTFTIRDQVYKAVKPCARCVIPTIDQATGLKGDEPTRTLATYRLRDKKIVFGQNVLGPSEGLIAVGDRILFNGL